MIILQLFKYIFENLEQRKMEYLISGSYALNLYSPPRSAPDIDIVADVNLQNLERSYLKLWSKKLNIKTFNLF